MRTMRSVERYKMALLNFLWPGFGYYNYGYRKGLYVMVGYFLLAFFVVASNNPGLMFLGFLVNMATVIHPLVGGGIRTLPLRKSSKSVLEEYARDTLKAIADKIDLLYQRYEDLRSKLGDGNKDIIELRDHIMSLRKHYNKARAHLQRKEYEAASDEATFAYRLINNIDVDISKLEDKYMEFRLLK